MLLYSLLHLFGYGGLSKEDLMNFRQLGSRTPGHPEFGHTVALKRQPGRWEPEGRWASVWQGRSASESVFNKNS